MRLTAEQLQGQKVTLDGVHPGEVHACDPEAGYVDVAERGPDGMLICYRRRVGTVVGEPEPVTST